MRLQIGIRGRLLILSLALIATTVLVLDAYVSASLRASIEEQLAAELHARGALLLREIEKKQGGVGDFQAFAEELSRRSLARVTLVAGDGQVLGDSEVSRDRLSLLENHGARPEIIQALKSGKGLAERPSVTVSHGLLYVALPTENREPVAVLRLAQSLAPIEASVTRSRELLLFGTLLALVVAASLSALGAHLASRSLRELRRAAHRMVDDLSVRTKIRGQDEVGALGEALDGLADSLSGSLDKLENERDRLEAILETMADGVLVLGVDGRIELASTPLRGILGIEGEVLGKLPGEAIPNEELSELLQKVARERRPASVEIDSLGSRKRRVRVRAAPLSGGPEAGIVAVISDVTELRRLETLRRDFVANASHELRTPIAAIRAATETLESGALDEPEEAREFVEIVSRHGARLHRLVEDLLDLSRIEAQRVEISPARVEVGELLSQIVDLSAPSAERASVSLRVELLESLAVFADRRALEQVLANLVDNAIKYAPGAEVSLRAGRAEGGVAIVVQDNGPGIGRAHLHRLFERFYRIDTGRSRALGGTGLGLSIAKHLVETMRGRITVESEPGEGTAFTVWLPSP